MKRWSTMSTFLLAVLMAAPGMAQNAPPASGDSDTPAARAERVRERFATADADHDGRLSRTEAQSMPFIARNFDAIDANHDGYVTKDELRDARMERRAAKAQKAGGQGQPGNPSQPPAAPGSGA